MMFAMVFAGQGSQSVGMMNGFGERPEIRATFDEASTVLGADLWALQQNGPAELQNQTVNTQPLMLTAGVATWRAWLAAGGAQPACMAGHSLGEYTALVAAGALEFADALRLVRLRAQAMQDAVPEGTGGIAAILGLDVAAVQAVCAEAAAGEVLEAVNLNSPNQVVIAGQRGAVERGMALAKQRGAKRALMLPMSVPSHCALMKPAAARLEAALATVAMAHPRVPVLQNADAAVHPTPDDIKAALVRQLYSSVRWIETVQAFAAQGIGAVVECVPGKVLTGLNTRIDSALQCLSVHDAAALAVAVSEFGAKPGASS
ncbi:MAG TPA: ACP S-malonyltransferase [Usitatibacteraceae bacterium]|nr:ACP S-malonyltransferase [Usitatibacteraceae bacterium]